MLLEMAEKEGTLHVGIRLGKFLKKKRRKQINECAVC
jgi:hypothetical protein